MRHRRSAIRDERNERRQANAQAARQAGKLLHPVGLRDDKREPGDIDIEWLGVSIHWRAVPDKRNVRRWRVFDSEGRPVFVGGIQLSGGRDAILRELAKLIPTCLGRRHWDA